MSSVGKPGRPTRRRRCPYAWLRPLAVIAFLFAGLFLLFGLYTSYIFETDRNHYAEMRCPGAPNRVDSNERQDCFNGYETKTGTELAAGWYRLALGLGTASVVGFIVGRPPKYTRADPWNEVAS